MTDDVPRVPVRTKTLLEGWVAEFLAQEQTQQTLSVKVAIQDGSDGLDTGLVIMHLRNAPAEIYMQPRGFDEPEWEATLTARTDDLTLNPQQMSGLAAEVALAANLCAFLQFKSIEWDRMSGMR
ncbi:hypothetical protein [Microbacterium imperiale]|uniref:Uncharacterized protein n=1 Tax=Microbacterium imperiale TaxID=33884 RepID=A0A9W6HGZ8_9MICO|nr:hypothetical protein [Microbacterium imperiale]MBP2420507.1 hypothetical protein [Microbacterium imperiale]MDS0200547.1 hypothetical protein [Microbacterium imperiale]BFE40848.1 hypothetical protein GCM10017544_18040 [Microbacterium imperiale]GLJ79976.1 hypothetical protein GCM10017586_16590 [Microbacterium imperiale]